MVHIAPKIYAFEHRLLMGEHLGRPLREDEQVHHRDGDRGNNDISNLQVVSQAEHTEIHRQMPRPWAQSYDRCIECGTTEYRHRDHGRCTRCYERIRRVRKGYKKIYTPDGRHMFEHRYIMEKQIGRPLRREEYVHHVNGDTKDNRPENLCIVSPREHRHLHMS